MPFREDDSAKVMRCLAQNPCLRTLRLQELDKGICKLRRRTRYCERPLRSDIDNPAEGL